jgi:hypothetical protein
MTVTAAPAVSGAVDRCPRCGGAFQCGMAGAAPCACTTLTLDAPLQAALRERFTGCLCLPCLQALAAGASLQSTAG